jgi:hypothetical protein
MSDVIGTKKLIVLQREDGLFFKAGVDCSDMWVPNPMDASDRSWCLRKRDATFGDWIKGAKLVEVEISARLTGKTEEHLYRNGELLAEKSWKRGDDGKPIRPSAGETVEYSDGWYFWNEVWTDRYGPFMTELEAMEACRKYANTITI